MKIKVVDVGGVSTFAFYRQDFYETRSRQQSPFKLYIRLKINAVWKEKKRQQGEKRDSTAKVIISKCMYLNTTHVSTIYSLFWNLDYD